MDIDWREFAPYMTSVTAPGLAMAASSVANPALAYGRRKNPMLICRGRNAISF
jgi:hypothetical protein